MSQTSLSPLPAAIVAEKRSNWPFLLRFGLVFLGLGLIMKGLTDHNVIMSLVIGAPVMASGLIGMAFYVSDQNHQNTALLDSLTMPELVSMLGRQADTWRSDNQIIRTLDRRFSQWRDSLANEAQS